VSSELVAIHTDGSKYSYSWTNVDTAEVLSNNHIIDLSVLTSGTYNLRVSVDLSQNTQLSEVVVVKVGQQPNAIINVGGILYESLQHRAVGRGSNDADGDNLTYVWYLDGQQVSTDADYSLPALGAGTYELKLVVSDELGFSDEAVQTITILPG
jgi:hypothetical protein